MVNFVGRESGATLPSILLPPSREERRLMLRSDSKSKRLMELQFIERMRVAPMFHNKRKSIIDKAKALRKNSTEAEALLWEQLRKRKLNGYKIRRQHPIGPYIADFFCAKANLVVEIDGGIHNDEDVMEYDVIRQKAIEDNGLKVIRFKNEEVFDRLDFVLAEIEKLLKIPVL
jgi:very-short-patch-repair endonuclease